MYPDNDNIMRHSLRTRTLEKEVTCNKKRSNRGKDWRMRLVATDEVRGVFVGVVRRSIPAGKGFRKRSGSVA